MTGCRTHRGTALRGALALRTRQFERDASFRIVGYTDSFYCPSCPSVVVPLVRLRVSSATLSRPSVVRTVSNPLAMVSSPGSWQQSNPERRSLSEIVREVDWGAPAGVVGLVLLASGAAGLVAAVAMAVTGAPQ